MENNTLSENDLLIYLQEQAHRLERETAFSQRNIKISGVVNKLQILNDTDLKVALSMIEGILNKYSDPQNKNKEKTSRNENKVLDKDFYTKV